MQCKDWDFVVLVGKAENTDGASWYKDVLDTLGNICEIHIAYPILSFPSVLSQLVPVILIFIFIFVY